MVLNSVTTPLRTPRINVTAPAPIVLAPTPAAGICAKASWPAVMLPALVVSALRTLLSPTWLLLRPVSAEPSTAGRWPEPSSWTTWLAVVPTSNAAAVPSVGRPLRLEY